MGFSTVLHRAFASPQNGILLLAVVFPIELTAADCVLGSHRPFPKVCNSRNTYAPSASFKRDSSGMLAQSDNGRPENAFEGRTKHSGPTSQLAASVLLSPWPDQAQMRAVCQLYCPRESNSDNKNNTHTHTQGSPGMNGTFIQQLLMVQNAAGEAKLSNTSSMSAR